MTPGTPLASPDGRRFKVHVDSGGRDQKGKPVVVLERQDRRPGEQRLIWRSKAEVETWPKGAL